MLSCMTHRDIHRELEEMVKTVTELCALHAVGGPFLGAQPLAGNRDAPRLWQHGRRNCLFQGPSHS